MRLAFCFLILLCGNLDVLRGRGQMLGIRPSSAIPIVRKSSVMTRPAASSAVLSSPQVLLQLHGRSGGQAIDDDDNDDDDDDGDDDADDDGDDGSDLGSSDEEESEDGLESQGSIDEENTTPEDLAKLEAEASPSEMEKKLKLIEGAQQAALTAKMQKQEKDLQKQMRQGAAAASQAMVTFLKNAESVAAVVYEDCLFAFRVLQCQTLHRLRSHRLHLLLRLLHLCHLQMRSRRPVQTFLFSLKLCASFIPEFVAYVCHYAFFFFV